MAEGAICTLSMRHVIRSQLLQPLCVCMCLLSGSKKLQHRCHA